MSVTGSLAGGGGRPGVWGISKSAVTSDISKNSSSSILLTTLCGSDAIGLKGPGAWSCVWEADTTGGMLGTVDKGTVSVLAGGRLNAAAASMSRLEAGAEAAEKVGSDVLVGKGGSEPRGSEPRGGETRDSEPG